MATQCKHIFARKQTTASPSSLRSGREQCTHSSTQILHLIKKFGTPNVARPLAARSSITVIIQQSPICADRYYKSSTNNTTRTTSDSRHGRLLHHGSKLQTPVTPLFVQHISFRSPNIVTCLHEALIQSLQFHQLSRSLFMTKTMFSGYLFAHGALNVALARQEVLLTLVSFDGLVSDTPKICHHRS
ncbi:hypothetical protein J6590_073703 [Homalodisca vitripennis]|nr:hypothetical protein J6590_073703 [Homalodisca vitripennis]